MIGTHSERNSLRYWFPKLLQSGVPIPQTVVVPWEEQRSDWRYGACEAREVSRREAYLRLLEEAGRRVGYPAFIRTDYGSGKHNWERTCHLPGPEALPDRVRALIEWSEEVDMIGLPITAFVLRRLLPVVPWFRAFRGRMPIATEVRCFVSDGAVIDSMPYWPADAIWNPDSPNWREYLVAMGSLIRSPGEPWRSIAGRVAACFADDGDWSVDLMRTSTGWYVIDMAQARDSYGCPPELQGDMAEHHAPPLSSEERDCRARLLLEDD